MPSLIFILAIFTLGAGLAFGLWQRRRARLARQREEHSALAEHSEQSSR